jgi:hypothetical protein
VSFHTDVSSLKADEYCSERKWKMQLMTWGFAKYVPASHMRILVAKAEKRAREEGKETIFFNGQNQIAPERIEHFKKRKGGTVEAASPSAGLNAYPESNSSKLTMTFRNSGKYYLRDSVSSPRYAAI